MLQDTSEKSLFYRWQIDRDEPEILQRDSNSVYRWLGEGTLLLKLGEQPPRQETYPSSSVREIKGGFFRKKGYEFSYSFTSKANSLLYHVVLPEFCYCDEESINIQKNVRVKTTGLDKRQSVTWVNSTPSEPEEPRTYELKFLFYGPNERKFREKQNEIPTRIVIPKNVKKGYAEFKDLAPIGFEAATKFL